MKKTTLILIFIFLTILSKAQEVKINYNDSNLLMLTWNKFIQAIDNSDRKTIKSLSKDSVECYCGNDSIESDRPTWAVDSFSRLIILYFETNKKLNKIVKTETPQLIVNRVDWVKNKPEIIYSLVYILYKPNEIAPGHEGGSIFFEFNKIKNKFVFRSISTVP
jgi:hypothetical protein